MVFPQLSLDTGHVFIYISVPDFRPTWFCGMMIWHDDEFDVSRMGWVSMQIQRTTLIKLILVNFRQGFPDYYLKTRHQKSYPIKNYFTELALFEMVFTQLK